MVLADDTHQLDRTPEGDYTGGDIGRSAGRVASSANLDHRDWSLGRNAPHIAPQILIEHDVADGEDSHLTERFALRH
jgi:hypothetical protein